MIPRVEAEAFEDHLPGGTTRPSILACVDLDSGKRDSYAVKYRGSRGDQCYEFLCITMGNYFGIDTLEPARVLLREGFGKSLRATDGELADRVLDNVGWNFGTRYLPGKTLPEVDKHLRGHRGRTAARIMAFDVLISNHDRHIARKTNLLADGDRILILDHELAFGWMLDLVGFHSWRAEANGVLAGHVFAGRVRELGTDLGGFTERLKAMTNDDIGRFFEELPGEFPCDHEDKIKEHLRRARDEHQDFAWAVLEAAR